jgi:hypothetical protein
MSHNKLLLIPFVLTFFFGCSSSENEYADQPFSSEEISELSLKQINNLKVKRKDSLTLEKDRIVKFKVDSTSRNFTLVHSFYNDSISYFVNRNEFTNSIDFYNYQTGDLEKRLTLKQDEPNGISKLEGFYIHNLDSIFAYSRRDNIIHLYNYEGNLKEYYKMPNDKSYIIPTHIYSGMYFFEDPEPSIYFSYSAIYPLKQIKDTSTMVRFNIESETIERLGPKYSAFVTNNDFLPTRYTRVFSNGHGYNLINKFVAIPVTYVFDINTNKTKVYLIKSKYHKSSIKPWDGKENKDAAYMKASYGKICYDPYRKVYYHLFSLDTPYLNEESDKNTFDDKQMSVIITDTTFQIIGEKLLEKNTYFRNMFVSEEGLLVSTFNIYNKNETESEIRFQLFNLQSVRK